MLRTTRRVLTGPLLVAAIGSGILAGPAPALAAGTSATIRVSGTLPVRSGPSESSKVVGSLANSARVVIDCVVPGQRVTGPVRTTDAWARLAAGRYVPHAHVLSGAKIRRCAPVAPEAVPVRSKPAPSRPTTAPAAVIGTVRSNDGSVNLRSAPSRTAQVVGSVANGTKINIACGVFGDLVSGTVRTTTQWVRTVAGQYVSHAYVLTPTLHLCPGASPSPSPAPAASMTNEQFIRAAVPGAQAGWREFGVPPSVTIAQAILESGWGRSGLASVDKNFFGMKCFQNNPGRFANGCRSYPTIECDKAGKCSPTSATFRTYRTVSASFRDHGHALATLRWYQPAFKHTRDANKFIWAVWKGGYATDPKYYTKITSIMAAHKLYQYDTWK